MKVDIGFWDINGNYIPDIQEIGAEEMDKEFFNDIDNIVKVNKLERENAELKEKNTALEETLQTIEQLKDEDSLRIAQLVTENARLKEEIKEVKKYQYEQEFLEKEIEEQREKNKRLTCKILEVKALNETLNVQCTSQDCTQLRKLHQTLQKIKAIVCGNYEIIDPQGRKDILKLITKAESEG